jgi:hypothetical protein
MFLDTGDDRFARAIQAIEERFGAQPKRGRRTEWSEFEVLVLWILVQARVRAFGHTISTACLNLSKTPHLLPVKGKRVSRRTLERVYHTKAVRFLKANATELAQAEAEVDAMARHLGGKHSSSARLLKRNQ